MSVVKGAISLKDNATAVLRNIKKEQGIFRKDVEKTRGELKRTWGQQYHAKVSTSSAVKQVSALKSQLRQVPKSITALIKVKDLASKGVSSIKSKVKAVGKMVVSPIVKLKDAITAKLSPIISKVKSVGKMVATPFVKLKDSASAGLGKISSKLKSVGKSVTIPVAIATAGATAALGGAVNSGMQLEQQQVSMKHFIGATNQGMGEDEASKIAAEFTNALRGNANTTPFETGEVMAAGSRAIAIAGGNTTEAMELVKLAEDMAAASGGTKKIGDAIEALADAKMGETERLKEFGFKVSADEFQSKGFGGVSSDLQEFYGGAAEKLSATGAGLSSTVKGKLKSNFADFGLKVVEKLKPAFESVIGLIDNASPAMETFSTGLADKIGGAIQAVTDFLPKLKSGIDAVKPAFEVLSASVLPVLQTVMSTVMSVVSKAAPIVSGVATAIGTAVSALAPVFSTIFSEIGEKVGSVIEFVGERMGFIQEIISTAAPVISDILETAWGIISPIIDICIGAFELLFGVVEKVFPSIQNILTTVWDVIKPIVEGVGGVVNKISDGWNGLVDKFTGGGKGVGANAEGTSNWRGGLTWVGEKGPELVNLPKGSEVLSNPQSKAFVKSQRKADTIGVPQSISSSRSTLQEIKKNITVTIAKLADTIIVREEADIEKLGTAMANEIIQAVLNMA